MVDVTHRMLIHASCISKVQAFHMFALPEVISSFANLLCPCLLQSSTLASAPLAANQQIGRASCAGGQERYKLHLLNRSPPLPQRIS